MKNETVINDLTLINHTVDYRGYNIERYFIKVLNAVPKEDLKGLTKINIYDDSSPKESAGLYLPPQVTGNNAEINIYLHQTLGYLTLAKESRTFFNKIKNRIFLSLFGKLFIAESLFHEIGHHKYGTIDLKQYKSKEEQEDDAENYASQLLQRTFPFYYADFELMNRFYRSLFKGTIEKSDYIKSHKEILDFEYFNRRGYRHLKKDEFEMAIKEFSRAIALNPTYYYAYFNRGTAELNIGKYKEAIGDYTTGITLCPEDPQAFFSRGYCYQFLGENEKAIMDFNSAIELDYPNGDIYAYRARCYNRLQNYEMAVKDLLEALKKGINEADIPSDLKEVVDKMRVEKGLPC